MFMATFMVLPSIPSSMSSRVERSAFSILISRYGLFPYPLSYEIQGVKSVMALGIKAVYVIIKPPSHEELERRLRSRATGMYAL